MIRRANGDDRAAVTALWEVCDLTRSWNEAAADFDRAVEGTSSDILLFEQYGRLAASVLVGYDGHRGSVYYLGVALDHRGTGLGRTLMAAAEQWLGERDVPKIQLMLRQDNDRAIRLTARWDMKYSRW